MKKILYFSILLLTLPQIHAKEMLLSMEASTLGGNTRVTTAETTINNNGGSLALCQNLSITLEDNFSVDNGDVNLQISSISPGVANTEHLVFIDQSLPDYKILESSLDLPASTIIFLDPKNYDGILKITGEIQKYDELKSIHIVGHAKPAELNLGSDNFWKDDLNMIQKQLNLWKNHVSADADLFLYGCSLAETVQGKETVNLMATLTGMDVMASTNLTGHASLNGDWNLEYKTGKIESSVAFSEEIESYKHTLQSLTFADLRTFEEVNEGSPGNWTYPDGTGRTAYQSNNTGQPVYLLSAESGYLNEVFKGTITVDASAGDNDDIGFAFGFNGVNDTYIWSWDMGGINMNARSGGAHLLYKKTSGTMSFPEVGTLIAKGPNNDPWAHGVTYQIEILYTADRIKVRVNGVEKFNVTASDAGVAQFPAGKFGFYNYSQGGVTFGNIQNAPASDDPVPPSAQDDSYGMSPNTTLTVNAIEGILKNDYDANLDEFTIVQVSDVSQGILSLDTNDGSFTYTPNIGYEGTDEFTYKLVQNTNSTESAVRTVTIGIIDSNQTPTDIELSNDAISEGAADNTIIGLLTTTDGDNPDDRHDYSLTDNGGGRFTVNGNTLVVANSSLLTPGDYNIVVRSTDLIGASYSETFTISVVSNDKPTSANAQVSMASGATYSFDSNDFTFNDNDGDTFGGIRIETAETAGDLEYNGSDVFDGTVINDISLLNFISPNGVFGYPYAAFTFKIVDSRGGISASSYTMNIEVRDEVNPTAIAQNVIVQLDATGNGSTTAALVDNGSNDASGIASLSLNKTAFSCSDIATNPNTVTLTVTDNNGNVSTATAEVTVKDEVNPTAIAQNVIVQLDATGNGSTTAALVDNSSSDACGIASLALSKTAFSCSDIATNPNTVTLTVTDNNGNVSTATAEVTVKDEVNPTAIAQNVIVQLDATGNGSTTAALVDNGSSDACGIASLALSKTAFSCSDIATNPNTVTLTVTDNNGNISTATAEVTVKDEVNPTIITRDITVQSDENGFVGVTAEEFIVNSSDNCSIANISIDRTDFDCANLGNYTITITAIDANGNTTIETAVLTITGDDYDGDLIADPCDTDDDGDGTPDTEDAFPLNENEDTDTDGDGTGDNADIDDDGDGTPDTEDDFPLDENEDTDTDGDGTGDNADIDDDGDGTPDTEDDFPLDENEDTDTDGDGEGDNADNDDDGDGTPDSEDAFPLNKNEDTDTDGDGEGDNADNDADNDGVPDSEDAFPQDPNEYRDSDGDGTGDNADLDDDNDGVEDIDTDGDGTGDNSDTDDDNDGVADFEDDFPTDSTETVDTDGDGLGDNMDEDDDNDGYTDNMEIEQGTNSTDSNSLPTDTDKDGIPDSWDDDDDNDGVADANDDFPTEKEPLLRPAEAFTPNGDGVNDNWIIPGIDNYPNATVTVYNRWGHQVFSALGYQNNWNGNHNSNSNILPAGSYLYIIDLGNGKAPIRGWLFLNY